MPPTREVIRSRLIDARKALGFSQQRVADAIAVAQSSIAAYEIGRASLSRETLLRYAQAVGLSEAELYAPAPDVPAPAKAEPLLPPNQTVVEVKLASDMASGRSEVLHRIVIPAHLDQAQRERHLRAAIAALQNLIAEGGIDAPVRLEDDTTDQEPGK